MRAFDGRIRRRGLTLLLALLLASGLLLSACGEDAPASSAEPTPTSASKPSPEPSAEPTPEPSAEPTPEDAPEEGPVPAADPAEYAARGFTASEDGLFWKLETGPP